MPEILFRGKRICYQKTGRGPRVVLLHGFGENGEVWKYQTEELQKHYTLIVPDLPGSRTSEMLKDGSGIDDYAEAVNSVMDREAAGEKFHLYGHSMGGYITMACVEKFSPRLQTFGLIHSSAFADTADKKEIRKKGIKFIEDHGGQSFLRTITPNLFSATSRKQHPEFVEELIQLSEEISDESLIQYYRAMMNRPDRSGLLSSAHLPVLFIIGRYDSVIPYEISLKQIHLAGISSVSILENSGHMGMWEEPEKTTGCMINFINNFHRDN